MLFNPQYLIQWAKEKLDITMNAILFKFILSVHWQINQFYFIIKFKKINKDLAKLAILPQI